MKDYLKLFLLLLFIITPLSSNSKIFEMKGDISFELPDSYIEHRSNNSSYVFTADSSYKNFFICNVLDITEFNSTKVLNSADTICNPELKKYELIDSEREYFFQWNKDYKMNYYKLDRDEYKYVTYTSYTSKPYNIIFGYKTDEELEVFEEIIDSIEYNGVPLQKVLVYISYAYIFWLIALIVVSIFGCASHDDNRPFKNAIVVGFKTTLITAALLVIVLWGSWSVIPIFAFTSGLIGFITSWASVYFTIET